MSLHIWTCKGQESNTNHECGVVMMRLQCNRSGKVGRIIRQNSLSTYTHVFVCILSKIVNLKKYISQYAWLSKIESVTRTQSSSELVIEGSFLSESSELMTETRARFVRVTSRIGSVDGEEDASLSLLLGMFEGAQCWGNSKIFSEDVAEVWARFRPFRIGAFGFLDKGDVECFELMSASIGSDNRCCSIDTSQCLSSPFSCVTVTFWLHTSKTAHIVFTLFARTCLKKFDLVLKQVPQQQLVWAKAPWLILCRFSSYWSPVEKWHPAASHTKVFFGWDRGICLLKVVLKPPVLIQPQSWTWHLE